ncbi:MAG: hypothetical protein QXK37_06230 [Candidatus Woesearchaeota archaeon]
MDRTTKKALEDVLSDREIIDDIEKNTNGELLVLEGIFYAEIAKIRITERHLDGEQFMRYYHIYKGGDNPDEKPKIFWSKELKSWVLSDGNTKMYAAYATQKSHVPVLFELDEKIKEKCTLAAKRLETIGLKYTSQRFPEELKWSGDIRNQPYI